MDLQLKGIHISPRYFCDADSKTLHTLPRLDFPQIHIDPSIPTVAETTPYANGATSRVLMDSDLHNQRQQQHQH